MGGPLWDKGGQSPGWAEDTGRAQAPPEVKGQGEGKWGKGQKDDVCAYADWEDGRGGVGGH